MVPGNGRVKGTLPTRVGYLGPSRLGHSASSR